MQHIQQMIDRHGGFEAVRTKYLRLENPPLMRLVIETIADPYPNGAYEVSVAHYSEQNGDAMRDPEITFLVAPTQDGGWAWSPLTFENSYLGCYQAAAEVTREGRLRVRDARLMNELRDFANPWDLNIKHQGFIDVFERKYGRAQNGDQNGATHGVR
jgi:hypothetical protein